MTTKKFGPRRTKERGFPHLMKHPLSQHPPTRHPPAYTTTPPSKMYEDPRKVVENLIVDEGVFKPDEGSIALAETSLEYKGRFLDMGTGSGFCAIYLYLNGGRGDASDYSERALKCAKKNFDRFRVTQEKVGLINSNLYEDIEGKYDRIVFDPPTNVDESEGDRMLKNWVKSHTPRWMSRSLAKVFQRWNSPKRREFLLEFIGDTESYLTEGGTLLLNVLTSDVDFIEKNIPNCTIERKKDVDANTILAIKFN